MKKFRYSMENILQIKSKMEEQMKIAYGNARMRLNMEEEKLQELIRQKASYEDELRRKRSDRLDIKEIILCEQAIEVTKQNIKQQKTVVRNAEHRLEIARIRLNDAMIERKTQEKLKEKAFDEYLLEYDAQERKEIDELNSFNYNNPKLFKEDE